MTAINVYAIIVLSTGCVDNTIFIWGFLFMTIGNFLSVLATPFLSCSIMYRSRLLYSGCISNIPDVFNDVPICAFYLSPSSDIDISFSVSIPVDIYT